MRTSETTNSIFTALLEVCKELTNPTATKENPHFRAKYTPLNDLIDHLKPLLDKNNLFLIQEAIMEGQLTKVITRLVHSSKEWIETDCFVPRGENVQKQGASITYCRRYALASFFNIASEEDDDANITMKNPPVRQPQPQKPIPVDIDPMSQMPPSLRDLFTKLNYIDEDQILNTCKMYNYNWGVIYTTLSQKQPLPPKSVEIPNDILNLFREKGFQTQEDVQKFCAFHQFDWKAIREALIA